MLRAYEGDRDAQFKVALMFKNHELAQFNVARAYYSGIGVNKDETRAKYWFQRAAANEEPRSNKILADVFNVPASQIGIAVSNVEPAANPVIASQTTTIQESDPSTYNVVSSTETMETSATEPVYESETTIQTDVTAVSDRVITSTSEPYTLPSEPIEIVEDISSTTEIISESGFTTALLKLKMA